MMIYMSDELSHYGVRGMKWGVRKQRPSAGGVARRALAGVYGVNERYYKMLGNKTLASMNAQAKNNQLKKAQAADIKKQQRTPEEQKARAKKAAKIGATVAVAALAAYGGKKLHDKQVLQMANAMAERGYGKGPNYFDSYKNAKAAWDGNYRRMISDVSDYNPRSRRFSQRELEAMGIRTFNVIDDSANRNRFR